jgi:hypothetical protein
MEMEQYELGVAVALERIAALRREADDARSARSRRQAAALPGPGGTTMLVEHQHEPGAFDPGHCRDCARQAGLLDHQHRVQREPQVFWEAQGWARQSRRHAVRALWASGLGLLLAAIALVTS